MSGGGFMEESDQVQDAWHSWDETPWAHPWLTSENLKAVRSFSEVIYDEAEKLREQKTGSAGKYAFCGNIANCMYTRAEPLRAAGNDIDLYLHPSSVDVLAHPGWEYHDGTAAGSTDPDCDLGEIGEPPFEWVFRPELDDYCANMLAFRPKTAALRIWLKAPFLPKAAAKEFVGYLCYLKTLKALQKYDSLWCTQCVYFGYLSGKPYIASQMGGDLWLEASRGDELGVLMRRSFRNASLCVFSNPWSLAHARRYGLRHFAYVPKILNEDIYCPGEGRSRKEWVEKTGGDFFALTSSRLDSKNKGSHLVIEAFARFAAGHSGARLAITGWGNDEEKARDMIRGHGIEDKVLLLPFSGKALVRDYLRSCDVMLDQFVLGYFGGAGLEAMACGSPVIGRIEAEQYEAICNSGAPPILNAATVEEIQQHLEALAVDSEMKERVGRETREWFVENHGSRKWEPVHMNLLAAVAAGHPFDIDKSPLSAPLGDDEIEYHREQLEAAPIHPNYGW